MEMIILTGLPGSGKTSYYVEFFAATHEHISKDRMPNVSNKELRQRKLIDEALAAGKSIVIDNINATAEQRRTLIDLAKSFGAEAHSYYFNSSVADCLARNSTRTGKAQVKPVAIYAAAKRLQVPSPQEEFDKMFEVTLGPNGFETSEIAASGVAGR